VVRLLGRDIEWGMCGSACGEIAPLGNALSAQNRTRSAAAWSKSTLKIKSAEKSNNQNGWPGIKQSKSHKYHYPIPLVYIIKTIKIPGKSREMENTGSATLSRSRSSLDASRRSRLEVHETLLTLTHPEHRAAKHVITQDVDSRWVRIIRSFPLWWLFLLEESHAFPA
jgi:hypothetical protein